MAKLCSSLPWIVFAVVISVKRWADRIRLELWMCMEKVDQEIVAARATQDNDCV